MFLFTSILCQNEIYFCKRICPLYRENRYVLSAHYRLTVRISIPVYNALFRKRLLRRDIAIVIISKCNIDFTQENLTRLLYWCCNQNQGREIRSQYSVKKIEYLSSMQHKYISIDVT